MINASVSAFSGTLSGTDIKFFLPVVTAAPPTGRIALHWSIVLLDNQEVIKPILLPNNHCIKHVETG